MTFGFSVSPTNSWLSATAASNTLSANGTASVNVTATASQTSGVASYTGYLTISPQLGNPINIPVTFTVTTGTGTGGSTLTVNNTNSNTATVSFSYVAPIAPGGQCIPLQDTATGANSYYSQVSTTNGGNWLLANNQLSDTTVQTLAPGSNACIDLSLSNAIGGLSSGAYSGSVAITSSSGSTATINVNLYVSTGVAPGITVQPGLIYVFSNVAANSSVVQQQTFSVTAAAGYLLGNASLTSVANGFSMSAPVNSNNTETFTVTSNSTGLATGIYSTTLTLTSNFGSGSNTTTITIILPVGQTGGE